MYATHGRVGASGTGMDGLLKLSAALDMIQDCSLHWMESEPVFRDFLTAHNAAMLLVSRQVDAVRWPVYGERVTAETRVYECRSFFGYRNTVLYGEDGGRCVLTWSAGAFVDRDSGKMVRVPPEVLDSVVLDEKIDMEYLDKKIALPDIAWRLLEAVPVRRGDIDFNRHMNNARYAEAALELLPEDMAPDRLRIEYKAPARPGALLYPRTGEAPDGRRYVLLSDAAGHPYAVMEFSKRPGKKT
ncbi:Acyl-ACP thioesterase [Sporobacter termitidis DSM 10068]|uniref:Acyl-ACP thioesterase n=1 Tax=Sporobacter termitidis DSM 10068 TaxID=1123282 RepID=A0A1M5Z0M2_9FIRM|nr:acyl-ACP thioesterase domain-containing protein [Sporobacter termitidis]SHI17684.1 Acyl-ACP thioesterase [Sporobacter termitidis DSM 10068]